MQRMTALFSAALLAAGMMTAQAQAQQDPAQDLRPAAGHQACSGIFR